MTTPLLEVRGATFGYGRGPVFEALDLDVRAGEVLTILGPNGCGKSTLLRCMSGAVPLDRGTVLLGQFDISRLDVTARARRIGFLFQQHVPSFPFPVIDVVSMGRAPHLAAFGAPSAKDMAIADRALERVAMMHLRDRPYTELSGGERQLVLLARTLAQEPDLILLDEPTAHLDFRNQAISLRTVAALVDDGVTMVMTTHDPNHAFMFPGRVALMKQGRIVAAGPAVDIVTDESLTDIYGVEVTVHTVAGRDGGDQRLCSAWP